MLFERPVLVITISYIIGILLGLYLEINIVLFAIIAIVVGAIIAWIRKEKRKLILICLLAIVISASIVHYREIKFKTLYCGVGSGVEFIGKVISVESESTYYCSYMVKVEKIISAQQEGNDTKKADAKSKNIGEEADIKGKDNEKDVNNTNIILRIKKNKNCRLEKLEYGDLVRGVGDFEKPVGMRNYGGFDYSQYLKTKNVYMICKSNSADVRVIKEDSLFVVNMWINRLNNRLKENIVKLLPNDMANVAIAFLLGDSSVIESSQREVFSEASLLHVLAISGMHVTYVIVGCSFLLKKFDKRKSKYVFIIFLIFFSMLTGGSPSVIRAVIMATIMLVSKLVYRKSDTINNISIACLMLLLVNPYNIFNLGFQLSFLGTLGIVLFNSKINYAYEKIWTFLCCKMRVNNKLCQKSSEIANWIGKLLKKLMSIIILSVSANILIFPILAYKFNIVSFSFLISNILVAPILGVMSLSGYLTLAVSLISIRLAKCLSMLLYICLSFFIWIAQVSSNISFVKFIVATPSIITIIIYYIITFYVFYFYKKEHNKGAIKIILLTIMVVIVASSLQSHDSSLKLYFIDVGQR